MANPASFQNVLSGTETTQNLLLAAGCTVGGRPIAGGGSGCVNTLATTLSLTAALHAGKTVTVSSTSALAITLPACTGTGDVYQIVLLVAATATAHTIATATPASENYSGAFFALTTSTDNVIGYKTTATDNLITINGTTQGGVIGDKIILVDVKTGLWSVNAFTRPTGSYATPFSHV